AVVERASHVPFPYRRVMRGASHSKPVERATAGASPGGRRWPPSSALLATTIFFAGTSYWPTEIAGRHASSLTLAALRSFPAALVLLAALPLLHARLPRGRDAVWSAVTGVLMVGVLFFGMTEGTVRAGGGNASVLVNTSPFLVLVLGAVFLSERITRVGIIGLMTGFGGVVVMVSSQLGSGHGSDLLLGFALDLAAAVAWAVGTLIIKWLVGRDPELDLVGFTAGQYAAGGSALLIAALLVDGTTGADWQSSGTWLPVAYLALGNSAAGSITYFAALKRLSATRAAAGLFLVPVVAVLVQIARGSSPTAVVLIGMALTIAGVALANLPPGAIRRRAGGGTTGATAEPVTEPR
ncbi:MAG: family transporter, partial [Conexibacter sp.]|nr:family transporter [Conexibacter sp.]